MLQIDTDTRKDTGMFCKSNTVEDKILEKIDKERFAAKKTNAADFSSGRRPEQ